MKKLKCGLITMLLFIVITLQAQPFNIGDTHPDGGIVFQVADGGMSGLIAASQNSPKMKNWDAAMEYCKNLGDGWRMPTNDEMRTMVENLTNGDLNSIYFWTSTETGSDQAQIVLRQGGVLGWPSEKSSDKNHVRVVRSFKANKSSYQVGDLHPDGGIVYKIRDGGKHGMMIKVEAETYSHDEAIAKSKSVGNGWELPNWQLLVEIQRDVPKLNVIDFPGTYYWSTWRPNAEFAKYVRFTDGYCSDGPASNKFNICLVKQY